MKIYFSVDTTTRGYPVHFIDRTGKQHIENTIEFDTPGAVADEFESAHPGAVYLSWDAFCKRLAAIEKERMRMRHWNEGLRV